MARGVNRAPAASGRDAQPELSDRIRPAVDAGNDPLTVAALDFDHHRLPAFCVRRVFRVPESLAAPLLGWDSTLAQPRFGAFHHFGRIAVIALHPVNNTRVRVAITRAVSPRIAECELSYIERKPIDFARAAAQHDAYERLLSSHGCEIVHVAAAPDMPDSVFVEDTAVVLDAVAIITRPGAPSRRGETESVAEVLRRYRPLFRITEPATLDGGDVLVIGQRLHIGISQRTNVEAIQQLNAIPVRFQGCLHLKSAVTQIDDETLLLNPRWVDARQFPDSRCIAVDPAEPFASNALRVGDVLLFSASYPRTRGVLESRGYHVEVVDVSELEKAEAGVTCCSIIVSSS
jgi:dimethylargininase